MATGRKRLARRRCRAHANAAARSTLWPDGQGRRKVRANTAGLAPTPRPGRCRGSARQQARCRGWPRDHEPWPGCGQVDTQAGWTRLHPAGPKSKRRRGLTLASGPRRQPCRGLIGSYPPTAARRPPHVARMRREHLPTGRQDRSGGPAREDGDGEAACPTVAAASARMSKAPRLPTSSRSRPDNERRGRATRPDGDYRQDRRLPRRRREILGPLFSVLLRRSDRAPPCTPSAASRRERKG